MPLDMDDPREWLALAVADLAAAKLLVVHSQHSVVRLGCFHIQQAAEKALKAVLVANGVNPPRTHDIGRLLRLCSRDADLDLLYEPLDSTTYFAVEIRYGDFDLPPTREIEHLLHAVDRLLEWVSTRIG